jgi:ATP synthase protein I
MGKLDLGGIAFIVGMVLAIIIAIFAGSPPPAWAVWVLAVLGLIVGLMNVTAKETGRFLIAAIAFMVTFSSLSEVFAIIPALEGFLVSFFRLLIAFVGPAAAIVALISLIHITKK